MFGLLHEYAGLDPKIEPIFLPCDHIDPISFPGLDSDPGDPHLFDGLAILVPAPYGDELHFDPIGAINRRVYPLNSIN